MTVTDIGHSLETKLVKALTELPAAYDQLHLFTLPGSRPNDGSKPRRGTLSTRAPLILDVLDLLDRRHKHDCEPTRDNAELDKMAGARRMGILPTLAQWVRLIDAELWDAEILHTEPVEHPTVTTECAWLQSHTDWISQQPWVADIVDDLTRMLKDCTLITGTGTDVIKLTCTNLGCGWPVYEENDGAWYHCTGCGKAWGRLELHKMAERKQPKTLTFCAQFAGLSVRTLNRYIHAGKIRPVARDGQLNLYDLNAVMEATMSERYKTA